jgi:ubiquinone/menaquinone biosynthesis C-methylase UbiE
MNLKKEAQGLRKMWGAFRQARVLMTANNLGIFDHLEESRSAAEVAASIKSDLRATEILLDALAGLELIKKCRGKYRNSTSSNRLLVKGSAHYQGDIIRHADNLWTNWSNLDEVVKTGNPARKSFSTDAFIKGMHNIAVMRAKEVIENLDLKGVTTALDLGGGPGTYTRELAKKVESVTLFDLPETIAIARDELSGSGLKNVSFMEGDFLVADIGSNYDLVYVSQVLHAFSETDNLKILRKANEALAPGGRIAIYEHFIKPDRTEPVHGSLFSVNMLVNTSGGRCYSVPEMKQWLSSLGFIKTGYKLMEDNVLVFGTRT